MGRASENPKHRKMLKGLRDVFKPCASKGFGSGCYSRPPPGNLLGDGLLGRRSAARDVYDSDLMNDELTANIIVQV